MLEIDSKLLWIGHALDARELRPLLDAGIESIIDLAIEEPPAQLPRQLTYCRFPLNDGGGNDRRLLLQALRTTVGFLEAGFPTLIACSAGMSRSPTIAAFALAHHLSQPPDDVIHRIARVRSLELKPDLWADVRDVFSQL